MKLSLGFSPCPNDTFLFDAMVHGKIHTEGLEFEILMADVEVLNQKAFANQLNITKLSYHAYAYLMDTYSLLDAGSALGNDCGPLLIAKNKLSDEALLSSKIAIPGKFTTANFLLSLAYPQAINREEMLFSDIEGAILSDKVDAGLIIHENRFTYQDKGLKKIIDLGSFWETQTGLPIPLGGIVIQNNIAIEIQQTVNRVLKRSVQFARKYPEQTGDFVQQYAQEMDPEVMYKHIGLYVNDFTETLGDLGKKAVNQLFEMAVEKEIIEKYDASIYVC